MACHVASWSMRWMRRLTLLVLLGALWEIPPLSLSLPSREKEQRAEELEAKKREEEEKQKEKQREKEEEERIKQKQAEQEEERKRKLKELAEAETDAVKRARKEAGRPLNSFEERRVRRQARSEILGGWTQLELPTQKEDWAKPLKPEVKAQLDDAVRFFSDTMRVPAALIGSAALGMLFLPPTKFAWSKEEYHHYQMFDFLYRAYVIFTSAALCMELTTVLETSNAHVQLLELGRHGLALEPTAMDLIMANLEFEYLVCSLSFLGGVVCFILATLSRVLVVFSYGKGVLPREPDLCMVVAGMMLSSLLWWLHLVNMRILEFPNFGKMIYRFLLLLMARFRNGEVGVMGCAALLATTASLAAAGGIQIEGLQGM
ncbi:unnamed protein product [Effrenium voratum]|nr:unnamed protein product [Effrenium voratum]CAJ1460118.1 unnamed protein product [Effrenium voratum]